MSDAKSFPIDIDISDAYLDEILKFIHKYYLLPQPEIFSNIRKTANTLYFTVNDPKGPWKIDVEMKSGKPIEVKLIPSNEVPESVLNEIKEDLIIVVQLFERNVHIATLYFAWVEGEEIIPEEPPSAKKRASSSLFTSTMILLYILFFGIAIVLFIFIGLYAVIGILGIQLVLVLFSNKFLSRMGKWQITEKNPYVHIVQYNLPVEEYEEFQKRFGIDIVIKMKHEIYNKSLALGKEPTCELSEDAFARYGMRCNPERKTAKTINVYEIVKRVAEKFNLPMPKIVISNSMVPNAAATGPSPSRGLVLITTGLLVQLEEDEIVSVIGHEFGHLIGRDPLILFAIISAEFILRLTIFLPIFFISPFLYLILAFTIIFFVAKFFEARADLISAITIGQPKVLAEALRKIGFQRLQAERLSTSRIPSWITWDPHPPIYFRVDRLEKMNAPIHIKYPLIQSAKDVFNGFKSTFRLK